MLRAPASGFLATSRTITVTLKESHLSADLPVGY